MVKVQKAKEILFLYTEVECYLVLVVVVAALRPALAVSSGPAQSHQLERNLGLVVRLRRAGMDWN